MSIQFGRWHYQGAPLAPEYLEKIRKLMERYGPDGCRSYSTNGVSLLYSALHTTQQSSSETQPHITPRGAVLLWDGRLDNRAEFVALMNDQLGTDSPDVSVVAAAYERWGTRCLAMLVGDWALTVWEPRDRSLILAKDPIGTRPLYYSADEDQVSWSTLLDPLVLFAGRKFELEEEYLAGWLAFFPAAHLTPYRGIESVPPSNFVRLAPGRKQIRQYWDFDPGRRIRYASDAEYEEHFRVVFRESVRRRLRSHSPVLAELSGGMDSTSIVSMADSILAQGGGETPRLDTLSYFDDSEPHWNERPYFTKVEEKRGRVGLHIDLGTQGCDLFEGKCNRFEVSPGSRSRPSKAASDRAAYLRSGGHRILLSGVGGDEVAGGVPTPTPELADLIARVRFRTLAHQLKIWALTQRKPWFHLLGDATARFLPSEVVALPKHRRPPRWLNPNFSTRYRLALAGYPSRFRLFGALPSFQENLSTLWALQRQLTCQGLPGDPPYEKRYPYLDRDLLEFLYAIPREQLVRPGQRRSLMRRALAGIVPEEVLNRRRKAYVSRAPLAAFSRERESLAELSGGMVASSLGILDARSFAETLHRARQGQEVPVVPLLRTIELEVWLRGLRPWTESNARMPKGLRATAYEEEATG